ncbi:VanZ family protein [Pseudoxanthomonas composti]|uniref:VanZ family protein n=1 Tax=Pseudoxanthomonas composti TaxID=2137479 RepID=A0A4Q1JSE6_9GAMM|nr:VanZ family protein [Pseudoxanthomonas composti]RXQ99678.1 VanZ family protein [Pseudoxanthomonas composti]
MAAVSIPGLKPLGHPRLWLALWLLANVAVVVVCLLPGASLPQVPDGGDKVEHALAYFVLAAAAVQLFATRRGLLRACAWLVMLGVLIEFAQGALTADRSADALDALADTVGVLLGLATAWTPLRNLLVRLDPEKQE